MAEQVQGRCRDTNICHIVTHPSHTRPFCDSGPPAPSVFFPFRHQLPSVALLFVSSAYTTNIPILIFQLFCISTKHLVLQHNSYSCYPHRLLQQEVEHSQPTLFAKLGSWIATLACATRLTTVAKAAARLTDYAPAQGLAPSTPSLAKTSLLHPTKIQG